MAKQIIMIALMIVFFSTLANATFPIVSPYGSEDEYISRNEDLKRLKEQYGDDITITPGGGIVSNVPFQGAPDDWFKPVSSEGLYDVVPVAYEDYANVDLVPAPAPSV
ncbi:hypothetical protein CASFOL_009649 [Castilleja foliolosa]|uniref:Uncharacterized protein n=1 Tax=Castilleja foliolosa TaxID=1961234 RepID=A0ABD3DUB1_9LAMI